MKYRHGFVRAGYLLLMACIAWQPSMAATFCVGSEGDLSAALAQAASNAEHDEIRIVSGQYFAPPGGWQIDLGSGEFYKAGSPTNAAHEHWMRPRRCSTAATRLES